MKPNKKKAKAKKKALPGGSVSRQNSLSSPLNLCLRHCKLSGHPLDFTNCIWHPQVNREEEALVSTQTVWFFVSLGRISPEDFQTQSCSFGSVNQQLKKNIQGCFRGKPASREPGTSDGSGEATRLPAPPGVGHRALEELPARPCTHWRSPWLWWGCTQVKSSYHFESASLVICCINSYLHVISGFLCCDMWVQAEEF